MKTLQELTHDLEFKQVEEFFFYIVHSEVNGQRQQVRKLINSMQKEDKKTFAFWCEEEAEHFTGEAKNDYNTVRKIAINEL